MKTKSRKSSTRSTLASLLAPKAEASETPTGLRALLTRRVEAPKGKSKRFGYRQAETVEIPEEFEAELHVGKKLVQVTVAVDDEMHTGPEGGKFHLAQIAGEDIGFRLYISGFRYALKSGKPTKVSLQDIETGEYLKRAELMPVTA